MLPAGLSEVCESARDPVLTAAVASMTHNAARPWAASPKSTAGSEHDEPPSVTGWRHVVNIWKPPFYMIACGGAASSGKISSEIHRFTCGPELPVAKPISKFLRACALHARDSRPSVYVRVDAAQRASAYKI